MEKKRILVLMLLFCSLQLCFAQLKVKGLLTENLVDPLGIGTAMPRFGWQLESKEKNVMQAAYELKVLSAGKMLWNSAKVASSESLYVPYGGRPLVSGQRLEWQVRVWDGKGRASSWSSPAKFTVGLLSASDWKAKWISPSGAEEKSRPSPVFRKDFRMDRTLRSALVYVTARGIYEAKINGRKVGQAYFAPGWTSYQKRLQYQVYDVASLLKKGDNEIRVSLGSGWYRGQVGFIGRNNFYGSELALLWQLELEYTDGSRELLLSDGSWKSATGEIRYAEFLQGETVDHRVQPKVWAAVREVSYPYNNLVASESEEVRTQEVLPAKRLLVTPKGEQVVDFGQNLAGFVRLRVSGKAGDTVVLEHAETLDKKGNFYTDNLRGARQRCTYVLRGEGEEVFAPTFSFQGFRYVRFRGIASPKLEQFEAVALYSDMRRTGNFECSNPLLNQLQSNILWSQRGNFIDIPTDCPQRDERMGWLADAQLFSRTAGYNYEVKNFMGKWLRDLSAEQFADGLMPVSIPNIVGKMWAGAAGWADALTVIPWNMYELYGDKKVLADQYASMKAWVSYMERNSTGLKRNAAWQYGDWLSYAVFTASSPNRSAITDRDMLAQVYFIRSVQLMAASARVLEKKEDQSYYEGLLEKLLAHFRREYVTASGRMVSHTQTAYVLALSYDLLPDSLRPAALGHLVENIASYEGHLTTGLMGTPFINHALTRFGRNDVAYGLLLKEDYPSWLYPVKQGATTIWERWDGIRPDGSFQDPEMNSLNHYVYGAIGDWMYRNIGGIDMDLSAPGYRKLVIRPRPGGKLDWARASYETGYGRVSCSWKISGDRLSMDVEVPVNTTAEVYVPKAGGKEFVLHRLGSGNYHFEEKW